VKKQIPSIKFRLPQASRCARQALFIMACAAISAVSTVRADKLGNPEAHGFSRERLKRLDAAVQAAVDEKKMAGGIVYLARDGEVAYLSTYGNRDTEAGQPMTTDTIFRLASMSKAVTSVAVMMLYEEGRFMLNDPIEKFIPAFKDPVVAVAPPPGSLASVKFVTVPAKRSITIRHLLSHQAGLTYGDGFAAAEYEKAKCTGWYLADREETIGAFVDRLAKLPLHGQPGESWDYGYATDVLGRFVEVVSGMPLDRFIEERICRPLGMKDTSFFLPPEKAERFASVYGASGGKLTRIETNENTAYLKGPRACFGGGAGLLSTVGDYGRFLQMLANGGELDGVRLLAPKTVELMHVNHTEGRYVWDTNAFGLGFWVMTNPAQPGELASVGSYGWGSAYFPQYFIDPKERLVGIFMAQLMPTGGLDLDQRYKVLTYQALIR
jgi:CubicO group peptidase (beta-lactamase class C family)